MKILNRDDTEHDVEHVTLAAARREIELKEKSDYWQSLCTLYADERNELRDAIKNLQDAKGRHHTEIAARALYALLPENVERIHGGAGLTNQPEIPTPLDGAFC